MRKSCTIDELLLALNTLRADDLCNIPYVRDILRDSPVELRSLEPYLFWDRKHYTRNLIAKTVLFELMAICWEIGQSSSIHNHANQNCWMAVPMGRLLIDNYHVVHNEEVGRCNLQHLNTLSLLPEDPVSVDPEEPVHRVFNPIEFGERAVSLHLYSRPFQTCIAYSLQQERYGEIPLHYTSQFGRRIVDDSE